MLQDFQAVGDSALDATESGGIDVCVVGAGAAGILLATELAARGVRVLLLEAGGLNLEERSQAIYETELTGLPYRGATEGRFRTYGGSTTRWGGQILELEETDFQRRDYVPGSGWPFPKHELTPYYERALRFAGLRGVERNDARVWAGLGLSICDLGPEFRMEYSRWCPERNFAILHRDGLLHTKNLTVLYHANVVGFVMDEGNTTFESLVIKTFNGRQKRVSAKHFVICSGGIESVRLLLQPLHLGIAPWQANGLLGKHYQDHIAVNGIEITHIATKPVHSYLGYTEFAGHRFHNKILLGRDEQVKAKSLNIAATIGPFRRDDPQRDIATVALREVLRHQRSLSTDDFLMISKYLPGIITETAVRKILGEGPEWARTMLTLHCEQSPLSSSAITLGVERDALGLFKARLDWQVSAHEIASLRTYLKRASEVFSSRRFAQLRSPKGFFEDDSLVRSMCIDSNHHMGGARMSVAESEGIVDPSLRLHNVTNGYLCSSAVFPCSGFSNPTHTLLALGMRLADQLCKEIEGTTVEVVPSITALAGTTPGITLMEPNRLLPQLGFGCSYLLGPGIDRAKSLRLLEAAYDAGIRYFDTARLYGQGECESLLGEFLRRHADARVGTKFGLEPPNLAQRALVGLGRRQKHLHRIATMVRGSGKVRFDGRTAKASLERSLKTLGREEVELFLLHEPTREELVHDDLLDFVQAQCERGTIANFGIGGEYRRVAELYGTRRAYAPVLQFEHSILSQPMDLPDSRRVHYRTFAKPAAALRLRLLSDQRLGWWWSEMVGMDLMNPMTLSKLFLRASLDSTSASLTLFSSSTEAHIYSSAEAAQDRKLSEAADRLRKLLVVDDLGIAEELYGG